MLIVLSNLADPHLLTLPGFLRQRLLRRGGMAAFFIREFIDLQSIPRQGMRQMLGQSTEKMREDARRCENMREDANVKIARAALNKIACIVCLLVSLIAATWNFTSRVVFKGKSHSRASVSNAYLLETAIGSGDISYQRGTFHPRLKCPGNVPVRGAFQTLMYRSIRNSLPILLWKD